MSTYAKVVFFSFACIAVMILSLSEIGKVLKEKIIDGIVRVVV